MHLEEVGISLRNVLDALDETRAQTLSLVDGMSEMDLERVHSRIMSPLSWDLGHIAAFEDLWLSHRFGGRPLLRPDLLQVYDAFESPRWQRGDLAFLRGEEVRGYLDAVRERTRETAGDGVRDGRLHDLVLRHEQQHSETMLQTIELAHLEPGIEPASTPPAAGAPSGLELVDVPGGRVAVGAPADGFAYDNERPRHGVELGPFSIGRAPITNATFLSFAEGGGYVRREWWSDEGWAWKEDWDITRPAGWSEDGREWRTGKGWVPLEPQHPVVHVSWFEADAFARAHDARLPTEMEWETAAAWDHETGTLRPPDGAEAHLDQRALGTAPAGAFAAGASPSGCLDMLGNVWEWTSSDFTAYPGFVADPYREYSAPFFGATYRVLRGGSWATRRRVATVHFRNWDLPERRQIFSGFRIARDRPS